MAHIDFRLSSGRHLHGVFCEARESVSERLTERALQSLVSSEQTRSADLGTAVKVIMPRDEKQREAMERARAREAKKVAIVDASITHARVQATLAAPATSAPDTGGAMDEVVPGVFVGGIDSVTRVDALADAHVTFLLSCCLEANDIATVRLVL